MEPALALAQKLRMPIGSLVLDAALVVALLVGQAQTAEKLSSVSSRVESMEQAQARVNGDARLLVLEATAVRAQKDRDELKADLSTRLNIIEAQNREILSRLPEPRGR